MIDIASKYVSVKINWSYLIHDFIQYAIFRDQNYEDCDVTKYGFIIDDDDGYTKLTFDPSSQEWVYINVDYDDFEDRYYDQFFDKNNPPREYIHYGTGWNNLVDYIASYTFTSEEEAKKFYLSSDLEKVLKQKEN